MLGKKRRLATDHWTIHRLTGETLRLLRMELQGIGSLDFFNRKKSSMINLLQEIDMERFSFRIGHSEARAAIWRPRECLIISIFSGRLKNAAGGLLCGVTQSTDGPAAETVYSTA